MPNIKRCPFCGNYAEYYQSSSRVSGHGESDDSVGIRCIECLAKITMDNYADYKVEERKRLTLAKWNSRVGS